MTKKIILGCLRVPPVEYHCPMLRTAQTPRILYSAHQSALCAVLCCERVKLLKETSNKLQAYRRLISI
jgi:hypothetical protein